MINVCVCDDVEQCCDEIAEMIKDYCKNLKEEIWIDKFYTGDNLLDAMDKEKYDMFFLDIDIDSITISYMCIIITSFAFSIINNGNILLKTQFNELLGLNMNYQNVSLIIKLIFLSYLTEIAVSAIQITISLLIDSVFSLIIVIGFWVLSVYWASPILINSYCFLQRTNIFINGTISLNMGLILDIIIIITCVSIGMFYFKRKDILV